MLHGGVCCPSLWFSCFKAYCWPCRAWWTTFSTMSSALWTTCIAVYVGLVIRNQKQATRRTFARFRLLAWGYPTLWVAVVLGRHLYTYGVLSYNSVGSGECFESPTFDPLDKPLHWVGYVLPLAVCMWITSHRYLEARLQMRVLQKVHSEHAAEYGESAMKYALIPTFFVISRSWIYVEAIVAIADPAWLPMCSCLRVAGVAAHGFIDALVFVLLTQKIRLHVFSPPKEEEDSYAVLSGGAVVTSFG
eukprot:GGOE01002238.1.p1 GENE.GGOE01002238.1~~GGOE01002238.1.p1  ORF type:complete len:247 (-),score=38.63 GGOE01002238.1:258-998(-)